MKERLQQLYDSIGTREVLEISLAALCVYCFLRLLGKTQGSGLVRGLGIIVLGVFLVSQAITVLFNLRPLDRILDYLHTSMMVGLVVIFQTELRRGLILVGRFRLFGCFAGENQAIPENLAEAAVSLSRQCVGALLAIERTTSLQSIAETGERLDAKVSPALIRAVFSPHGSLHDGAIIVAKGRIAAAGCQLPLGLPPDRSLGHYGMRHRAALCLSEETDAIALVVSEETGRISLAVGGRLETVARENLSRRLIDLLSFPTKPTPRQIKRIAA